MMSYVVKAMYAVMILTAAVAAYFLFRFVVEGIKALLGTM